jgi:hypothetical protein
MKFANLDEKDLLKVRELEEQMNSLVLVMERHSPLARLDEAQLEQLRAMESDLGVLLVAYAPGQ